MVERAAQFIERAVGPAVTTALLGASGPEIAQAALKRARRVADVDEILATRRC